MPHELPAEILAFVQRCQVVAGVWALHAHPQFDISDGVTALLRCFRTLPPLKSQLDRIGASSAIIQLAWNVRQQLPCEAPAAPSHHLSRSKRLSLAVRAVAAFRDQPVSLALVARWLDVTDSHLSRLIHQGLGLSFPTLLHGLRMIDVIVLLRTSTLSIKEVAALTGYAQTKALDRVFHEWFQMSPSHLRAIAHANGRTDLAGSVRGFLLADATTRPSQIADALRTDFGLVAQQWQLCIGNAGNDVGS
jgi:AraC-like DNA-binding protein